MVDKTVYDWEVMNDNKPIWLRAPKDVEKEDYDAFYKSFSKDSDEPLAHVHFSAEGEVTFRSILYVPKTAPYDLYQDYGEQIAYSLFEILVILTLIFRLSKPFALNFLAFPKRSCHIFLTSILSQERLPITSRCMLSVSSSLMTSKR